MMKERMMELEESDKYRVLKIDMDIVPPDDWIKEWKETRTIIIMEYGHEVTKIRMQPSKKGLHFWFHIDPPVDYERLIKLQFLCGDDAGRVYFGLQRRGFKRFRGMFNILFNRKWRIDENEKD